MSLRLISQHVRHASSTLDHAIRYLQETKRLAESMQRPTGYLNRLIENAFTLRSSLDAYDAAIQCELDNPPAPDTPTQPEGVHP